MPATAVFENGSFIGLPRFGAHLRGVNACRDKCFFRIIGYKIPDEPSGPALFTAAARRCSEAFKSQSFSPAAFSFWAAGEYPPPAEWTGCWHSLRRIPCRQGGRLAPSWLLPPDCAHSVRFQNRGGCGLPPERCAAFGGLHRQNAGPCFGQSARQCPPAPRRCSPRTEHGKQFGSAGPGSCLETAPFYPDIPRR